MLALSGCAVPTAVTIASFAADGVSYIATGKSTTDHAVSAIAQEDCAMLRALEEKAICVPFRALPPPQAKAEPKGTHPTQARQTATGIEAPSRTAPPKTWNFPLVGKNAVAGPDAAGSPQLVEKGFPARLPATAPVRIAKHPPSTAPKRAEPPLATGRIVQGECSQAAGMLPAAQCALGPGA